MSLEGLRERFPRVGIAHDWLTIPGGSEQVLVELLEMFPAAELFTSVYDPRPWPAIIAERPVHASALDRLPGARRRYPLLLPLMDRAFRSFDLSRFDLVIASSHAFAKNVRPAPGTPYVVYCHTPMRYAWQEDFLRAERLGGPARLALPWLARWLRRRDLAGARRPDCYVANSVHVAERIERHYGRSARVVHPPVEVERFLAAPREERDYYLVFGRVVPYKRVDLAVDACIALGRALKVAGDGRALAPLRAAAEARDGGDHDDGGSRVEFLGAVSDGERDVLLGGARALIFPGEEDFGIVPVEAQAAGVPVIAYRGGGASETVIDGQTGVLFDRQDADSLAAAIERFEGLHLDTARIRENARSYGRERFRVEMAAAIEACTAASRS